MSDPLTPIIIFEDPNILVLSKPAGLLSQGEITGDANLVDWLRVYLGRPYVGLIHRLDRNTSGIMLVAKRSKPAERLSRDLQDGKIFRSYLGWVEGRPGQVGQDLRWRHFLQKDTRKNVVRVISLAGSKQDRALPQNMPKDAKEAILTATPLQYAVWNSRPVTLVRFVLETGRSHQIRVQSAHEKYPLLGDSKYGPRVPDFPRPALHSHQMSFEHPLTHEKMEFEAPYPDDFRKIQPLR